jgi:hypothetical protein
MVKRDMKMSRSSRATVSLIVCGVLILTSADIQADTLGDHQTASSKSRRPTRFKLTCL